MGDWRTRLVVSMKGPNGQETEVTPIDSFSPTFNLGVEVLHSLERTHAGVVYSPQAITFQMTVKAMGVAAAKLSALALSGQRFNITLQESEDGGDWAFSSMVLEECLITTANPTSAAVTGAPTAQFTGVSLKATVSPKGEQAVTLP